MAINSITGPVFFFVIAVGLFAVYAGRRLDAAGTDLKKWGYVTAWQGVVWPVLYFNKSMPLFFTHVVAPFTLVMTLWAYLVVLRRHCGKPVRAGLFFGVLLFLFPFLITFVYIMPNPDLRKVSVSSAALVFEFSILHTLMTGNRRRILPSQHLMISIFIILMGMYLFRTGVFITGYISPDYPFPDRHEFDMLMLVASMFCCILAAFAYILMCTDRHFEQTIEAENARAKAEKEFRMVRDNVPVMIWTLNARCEIAWLNKAWVEFTGQSLSPDSIERWHQIIHPEDRERVIALSESAEKEHRPYCTEYRLRRRDGLYCWVMETGIPLQDEQGEFSGYVGSTMDVTITREMESAIANREARLRTVFDVLPVGIIVLDSDRRLASHNHTMLRILRVTEEQLKAGFANYRSYFRADGSPLPADELPSALALRTGKPVRDFECGFMTESGEMVWTLVSAEPLPAPHGGLVMAIKDISERKKHLLQIESLSQELIHAAEKERAELAGELHDSVGQSLVFATLSLQDRLREIPAITEKDAQQMLLPIRKALETARAISHRLSPIHLENLGLKLAIEDLLHDLVKTGKYRIKADIEALPDDLPGGWSIDFYRIVQEALSNIIKHANATQISLTALRVGTGISFEIGNDGCKPAGAPDEEKQPGIGLLMMQQRAKAFHGTVRISRPDGMFIVRIEIPASTEKFAF